MTDTPRFTVFRAQEGKHGWAILDTQDDAYAVVDGARTVGLTKWEARQVCGWLNADWREGRVTA